MKRRVNRCSQRGLLLVEAVLSAVAIGVGLVLISRGLSSQLRALTSIEEYDVLLSLGQNKLAALEGERMARPPSADESASGAFAAPYYAYQWTVKARKRVEGDGKNPTSALTLTVQKKARHSTALELEAVWPTDWVPAGWF